MTEAIEIMSRADAEAEIERIGKSAKVALEYCPESCQMKQFIKRDFMAAQSCHGDVCRRYLPIPKELNRLFIR